MSMEFVIFDRDGTLIEHIHHLNRLDQIKLRKDALPALLKLSKQKFHLGIISNQSVVGRGLASMETVMAINSAILSLFASEGIYFDFVYFCPHLPADFCNCRKPRIGLGELAIREHKVDPSISYMVGDQESDVVFGSLLGLTTIHLVDNGQGCKIADYHSANLEDAVETILRLSEGVAE